MVNKVAARYRNYDKRIQVDIESDIDNPISPLSEEDWMSFPTSSASNYDYGTDGVVPEALANRVRQARREGGFAIPVDIQAQSYVIFTAREADEESEDAYGYLIVTAKGLRDVGLERKKAIEQGKQLLETYNHWANGHSWRLVRYTIERCNLGHWHEREREVQEGYIGPEHEQSGILEDAGVTSGQPARLAPGWTKIAVDQPEGRLTHG